MNRMKWRGTVLFVVILTVMGLTIGLRLYGVGQVATGSTAATAVLPTSSPSATASAAPSATASASPSTSASSSSAGTASASASKTVDGAVEQTPYGPIQVQITAKGKTITAVTVLQSPSDRGRSVEINAQATPILAQEVLSSQSAKIDTVSGATYTSEGYSQSVQAAIDKL
ncbi:FMN-binding protein [Leifsonia poae]|uniref:FMN-binding protein n=1 Tax=Leifsonia poae TaxID=110933 RepID=UPI001CBB682E|nr:FMN-binding protein [Leifsonia poae]